MKNIRWTEVEGLDWVVENCCNSCLSEFIFILVLWKSNVNYNRHIFKGNSCGILNRQMEIMEWQGYSHIIKIPIWMWATSFAITYNASSQSYNSVKSEHTDMIRMKFLESVQLWNTSHIPIFLIPVRNKDPHQLRNQRKMLLLKNLNFAWESSCLEAFFSIQVIQLKSCVVPWADFKLFYREIKKKPSILP